MYIYLCIFCLQFGFIGLVAEEYKDTLSTVDPDDILYLDYVEEGRELAKTLKQQVRLHTILQTLRSNEMR